MSPALRETLQDLTDQALLTRCAGLRSGPLDTPTASAKHTLRALARRWIALADEITTHDRHLARLTTETSPTLRAGFGVGAGTAAEMLILFGDNPDRIHSEAAFAKLCGACPIPASSGRTTGRHRLSRGGHRQANAALYRCVIVRMRFHHPPVRIRRTTHGRRPDQTRDHPVPQTLPGPRNLPACYGRLPHAQTRHAGSLNACLDI